MRTVHSTKMAFEHSSLSLLSGESLHYFAIGRLFWYVHNLIYCIFIHDHFWIVLTFSWHIFCSLNHDSAFEFRLLFHARFRSFGIACFGAKNTNICNQCCSFRQQLWYFRLLLGNFTCFCLANLWKSWFLSSRSCQQ